MSKLPSVVVIIDSSPSGPVLLTNIKLESGAGSFGIIPLNDEANGCSFVIVEDAAADALLTS